MSAPSPPIAAAADSQTERQLVVFSLHDEDYALPITSVREIIRYQSPRGVGQLSSLMQGVICVRGQILPVCDLSSRLGKAPDIREGAKILIVDTREAAIGLIVDDVNEVILVAADQIEPLPVSGGARRLGDQIATVNERLIVLLDAERDLAGVLSG